MKLINVAKTVLGGVFALVATTSHAGLILMSAQDFGGTGLGAVNTILTIQAKGSGTTESGAVSYATGVDVITGDAKTGASQTLTRTLGSLGITSAESLRIVFNAVESDNLINLTGLTLSIYNSTGAVLFVSNLNGVHNGLDTESGVGNSGFVFGFDVPAAALAQLAVFDLAGFENFRLGLAASATGVSAGAETFFGAVAEQGGGGDDDGTVPEPASIALLGLGLAGLAFARRKQT